MYERLIMVAERTKRPMRIMRPTWPWRFDCSELKWFLKQQRHIQFRKQEKPTYALGRGVEMGNR